MLPRGIKYSLFMTWLIVFITIVSYAHGGEAKEDISRSLDANGFVVDWLICGPYPNYVAGKTMPGLDDDQLAGETTVKPYPGLKSRSVFKADIGTLIADVEATNEWGWRADKTFDIEWKAYSFQDTDGKILLSKKKKGLLTFPVDEHYVFYAACWVESPDVRQVEFRVGSDDYHKLYLNGKVVGVQRTSQSVRPDDFIYKVELRNGLNFVLLKIVNVLQEAGYCLAITDPSGKASPDIKVYTDSPARRTGSDMWSNGLGLKILNERKFLFDDEASKIDLQFFADDDASYTLLFQKEKYPVTNAGTVSVFPKLSLGDNTLAFTITGAGKSEVLRCDYKLYSKRELAAKLAKIQQDIADTKASIVAEKEKTEPLNEQVAAARVRLDEAVKKAEEAYAKEQARCAAAANPSVDLPFTPAADLRSRLCLNGLWKAGKSKTAINTEFVLPAKMMMSYYASSFPLEHVDPKNKFGQYRPIKGWEDYVVNPLTFSPNASFSRDFYCDDDTKTYRFVCEAVSGQLKVYCNDVLSGEYEGTVGIVDIPLTNVIKGRNTITLEFSRAGVGASAFGLCGDIYLDSSHPVRVHDAWVRTSWRNASIRVTSELENATDQPRVYQLRQYAVRNGRVRLQLPEKSGELPPNSLTVIDLATSWRDPELWSIENPALYHLVSDLYVDGQLVDRKTDRFGFREFWIHGVDFFFNGKRIILQGDVGHASWSIGKWCDVAWPLYREDGINMLRLNSGDDWKYPEVARRADEYGMLIHAQMHPIIDDPVRQTPKRFTPVEQWRQSPFHQANIANYRRWHRMLRNSPSVIIWSIDNEITAQTKVTAARQELNIRNEIILEDYARDLESVDPAMVITRDGDSGTWHSRFAHSQKPIRPVANYHYPDFNIEGQVLDWQRVYEYRPVIFGETLYCSYGSWDGWPGATPFKVAQKALLVRSVAKLYRELNIPAPVFMGYGSDGFVELKPDGSGSPWGVFDAGRSQKHTLPDGWRNGVPLDQYPYMRVDWPAFSGPGLKRPVQRITIACYGEYGINWFSPKHVSHVRNAVNDAYRDTLRPQPKLHQPANGECIIKTAPFTAVWTTLADGLKYGVVSDADGKAWFQLEQAGSYEFCVGAKKATYDVPSRAEYARVPGFEQIKTFTLE